MPTSPFKNIEPILDTTLQLRPRPKRVLDIGIGYGKWGFLCKEYLTYWQSPDEARSVIIDGIEAFPDYVGALQRQIYDELLIGDALQILPHFADDRYDLILLIDVLEHFTKQDGLKIIQQCKRVGKVFIVSTPRQFWPQEDSWGNPYERHLSLWTKTDFLELGAIKVIKNENWIAIFAKPPYHEKFTLTYRIWRLHNRWTPSWLRSTGRNIFRKFIGITR